MGLTLTQFVVVIVIAVLAALAALALMVKLILEPLADCADRREAEWEDEQRELQAKRLRRSHRPDIHAQLGGHEVVSPEIRRRHKEVGCVREQ